jgi:hypothetical protein
MRTLSFIAVFAFSLFTHEVAGQTIPTITAGPAQPGSADGAWINWRPIGQPPQQGSAGLGFADNAIAEWDVPQYSLQSGTFNICVIGYQISGSLGTPLAHVTFYLDNGAGVDVTTPNFTKTFSAVGLSAAEFCVQTTDTALYDGQHEFRAIAYPERGYPRVMQSVATVNETSGSKVINHIAHGSSFNLDGNFPVKPVIVSDSSDTNIPNGNYWIIPYGMDPSNYELATTETAKTGIVAAHTGTLTVAYADAGLNETWPLQSESLFISTNGHGHLLPSNSVAYADLSGANSNSCLSSNSPCADIPHAIDALFVNAPGVTYKFTKGSSSIRGSGNQLPLNQAVTLSGSPIPAPFIAGRPYWVVSTSGAAISLGNRPGGPAITVTGSTTSAPVMTADYSNFTLNLMCDAPCSSPSDYSTGARLHNMPSLYGWFNVQAFGTAGSNTPLNNGTAFKAWGVDKLHLTVDVTDNPASPAAFWVTGANDTWWDSMQYAGFNRVDPNSAMYANGGPRLGHYIATNDSARDGFTFIINGTLLENSTISDTGTGSSAMVMLGNAFVNTGKEQVSTPITLSAGSPDSLTLKAASVSPYFASHAGTNVWGISDYPINPGSCIRGNTSRGGNSPGVLLVSGFTPPDTITLASPGTKFPCRAGQRLWIQPNVHGNLVFHQYGGFNFMLVDNTCSGTCAGRGISQQSSISPTGYGDYAIIGNNITMFYSVREPAWQTSMLQIQARSASNFIIANNTLAGGGIAADDGSGPSDYTDMYFVGNQCNGSTARAATKGLSKLTGWTVIQGLTGWGRGTGC